jgi:hypothetical protein
MEATAEAAIKRGVTVIEGGGKNKRYYAIATMKTSEQPNSYNIACFGFMSVFCEKENSDKIKLIFCKYIYGTRATHEKYNCRIAMSFSHMNNE